MKRLVIVVLASILSMTVFAEGYQVNLLSTKQTGMGHVGTGMKLGAERVCILTRQGWCFCVPIWIFRWVYLLSWPRLNIVMMGIRPRRKSGRNTVIRLRWV